MEFKKCEIYQYLEEKAVEKVFEDVTITSCGSNCIKIWKIFGGNIHLIKRVQVTEFNFEDGYLKFCGYSTEDFFTESDSGPYFFTGILLYQ